MPCGLFWHTIVVCFGIRCAVFGHTMWCVWAYDVECLGKHVVCSGIRCGVFGHPRCGVFGHTMSVCI